MSPGFDFNWGDTFCIFVQAVNTVGLSDKSSSAIDEQTQKKCMTLPFKDGS